MSEVRSTMSEVQPTMSGVRSLTDVHLRTTYPMARWGKRVVGGTTESKVKVRYFGRVSVPTKLMLVSVPCVRQMMQMIMSISGTFFTDDYPRVPLSSVTIFGALRTFLDIWVDPLVARWSDSIRRGFLGCGPFCGRRRPFYLFGGMSYMLFSILLLSPPMQLSEHPAPGAGPGAHQYWRVRTAGAGGAAPRTAEAAEFFTTGYAKDSTLVCSTADGSSAPECAVGGGDGATDCGCFLSSPEEVLNVRAVIPQSSDSVELTLEYSDDGLEWNTAFRKLDVDGDVGQGEWRYFSFPYTSLAGGLWYGVNILLTESVAVSLLEEPTHAFRQEITPDEAERVSLFSWFGAAERGAFAGSIVAGLVIQAIFGNTCDATPYNGCNLFLPWSIATAVLFFFAASLLVWKSRERPVATLPAEENTNSLCETVVTTIINRPWRIMLMSEMAEAVGNAMRTQAVYWYFTKYVLLDRQVEAELGINYLTQAGIRELASNLLSVPFYPLWSRASRRFGVYRMFLFQNVAAFVWLLLLIAVLTAPCAPVTRYFLHLGWNVVDMIIRAGFPLGQVLMNEIIDYDEFLTGQRREAQLSVMKPFFEKFAFIPSTALPLVLMQWFCYVQTGKKYDPTQNTQPSGVVWSLVLTRSLLPGLAFMLSAWLLRSFPMRHAVQHRQLLRGIDAHRAGKAAADPYYRGSQANVVEATCAMDGNATVRYGSLTINARHKRILSNFFPSELRRVSAARDVCMLPRLILPSLIMSSLLFPSSVALFAATFGPAQASDGSILAKMLCPLATMMMSAGGAWLWFSATRHCKAREALVEGVSLEEVEAQLAMYLPFIEGVATDEDDRADDFGILSGPSGGGENVEDEGEEDDGESGSTGSETASSSTEE